MRVINITSASYMYDYRIRVTFSDGSEGVADFAGHLTGSLAPLADKKLFAKVSVDRTLIWPGDFDVATEFVYALAHGLTPPKNLEDVKINQGLRLT